MKIVFIIGTGRNGSTILDIMLGNAKTFQSCGEVYNAFYVLGKNKNCACSRTVTKCSFWGNIFVNFFELNQENSADEIAKLHRIFERKLYSPLLFYFHKLLNTKSFKRYLRSLEFFYKQIEKLSDKQVIIDSSKNPLRGAALLEIFKNEVYFIHLVRDGRGQLMSWFRSGIIPPLNIAIKKGGTGKIRWWASSLYSLSWIFYNLLSSWVIKGSSKGYLLIRYQDFVNDPARYFSQIGVFTGEDISDLQLLLNDRSLFKIDHLIAGNRIRFQKNLILKAPDEKWKTQLNKSHKRIFWILAGWLAKKYGYKF